MNLQTDVCIVGAGPAGALLGYLLAKQGISTILLERHPWIEKEFRGEHLNADGEQILKKHGLFDKIEECGILTMQRVEYWDRNGVVRTISPDPNIGHVGIHVPQNHLLHTLIEESKPYSNFQLLMNATVTELTQNGQGSYNGLKVKINEEEEISIRCSIVIGADGRYSTVRKLAEIPVTIMKHGYDLLWAKVAAPLGWEPTIRFALIHEQQLALFTQAGGFIQIGWNIEEGSFFALKKQPFEPFIKLLLDVFPDLTESVNRQIRSWKDFVFLNVQSCRCETWVKDGLVILGDAAHTMSPTGAIGVNSALKDADQLAEVLREVLADRDFSAARLHLFENIRREEIDQQQEQQRAQEALIQQKFERS